MPFSASELTPILGQQPGVCRVCRGWSLQYPRCWHCQTYALKFDVQPVPKVLPLGLSVKGAPLGHALRQYKDGTTAAQREAQAEKLRDLLAVMTRRHEACLARVSQVEDFDLVTWVPSAKRSDDAHPLRSLIAQVPQLAGRFADTLEANGQQPEHVWVGGRWRLKAEVTGRRVLLIDDTWTNGASTLSAARLMQRASADVVSIMVLGRHFNPDFMQGHLYQRHADAIGFSPDECTSCDRRSRADPPLTSFLD